MKLAICYVSTHHGNTKKLVEGVARKVPADLFDRTKTPAPDLSGYDLVGFASGVYYGGLHKTMEAFLERANFRPEQKVFFLVTCGIAYRDYSKAAQKKLRARGVNVLGAFQCRGYDTFGPFGKIGGIAKGRPNETDIRRAQVFVDKAAK